MVTGTSAHGKEPPVPQSSFVVAMTAEISFGAYETPMHRAHRAREWVIVAVWGTHHAFLTLSYTHVPAPDDLAPDDLAPDALQPRITHLGVLLSRVLNRDEQVSEYLLMRNRPADVPVAGVFSPTDGFVRVVQRGQTIEVVGHGRYAHAIGDLRGQRIVRDVPDPPPGLPLARAWHLTAGRRPWIGEVFGTGARPTPLRRAPARLAAAAPPLPVPEPGPEPAPKVIPEPAASA